MTGDAIFVISDDGKFLEMLAEPFASEDELQLLLATHWNVMPGAQIDPVSPRRWMLIDREVGVPATESGGNQWSLDHLFVDQDAVPTIVEVKRASDSRIRREVVGQMLDYAANGVRYWPPDELRARWLKASSGPAQAEATLRELIGPDSDTEEFWQRVDANLRAGRVRLLFVADRIPPELQRIVEFLNEQMRPAEVLAIELRHYRGGDSRTLVPRLFGATAIAKQTKSSADLRTFAEILAEGPEEPREADRRLQEWARERGLTTTLTPKTRQVRGSDGKAVVAMYAAGGWIEVGLGQLADAGLSDTADLIADAMDLIAERRMPRRSPGLYASQTVPKWQLFVNDVLDPYLEARRQLSRVSSPPNDGAAEA